VRNHRYYIIVKLGVQDTSFGQFLYFLLDCLQVASSSLRRLGTYLVALEGEYQDGDELGVQPLIYEYL
jgi:hypothetical protein